MQTLINSENNPQKIARICWNYYNWTKPSGKEGKSLSKESYEYQTGFGMEEWLLDLSKVINGYHYAFLQQINANWTKYIGEVFDIHLYSIDNSTKERWWLGKIKNVHVISRKEAESALNDYKQRGWTKEMIEQLKIVDADSSKLLLVPQEFVNIKFKPNDCNDLFDVPLLLSETDNSIKATYYTTLLNKQVEPVFDNYGSFVFVARHNPQKRNATASYGKRLSEIDRLHAKIQDSCYEQLVQLHGKLNVGTEIPTGYGASVDIVVKADESFTFFEIKTNRSVRTCIREALSQLLEYAHFPDKSHANKFIIISQNHMDNETKKYLKNLRNLYKLPIYYQQFDNERNKLLSEEY